MLSKAVGRGLSGRWWGLLLVCLLPVHASGLGLGTIEVHSALNEPFHASIALRDVERLSERQVLATLAPHEAFERAGVERPVVLSDLQFKADFSDADAPVLQVTSARAISEPFLNFILEVRWPDGRLQREYTVLVDPPDYRPVAPARQAPVTERQRQPEPESDVRAAREPAPSVPTAEPASRLQDGRFGMTDRYDTLWSIAAEVRPGANVSVQQTMLALQRLNPEAFVDGNINLLRAGFELQVPERSEIERLGAGAAAEIVAEHNAQWQRGTPGRVQQQGALRVVAEPEPEPAEVAEPEREPMVVDAPVVGSRDDGVSAQVEALTEQLQQERSLRQAAEAALARLGEDVEGLRRQLQIQHELLTELQAIGRDRAGGEGVAETLTAWRWPALALALLVLSGLLIWLRRRQQRAIAEPLAGANADPDGGVEQAHADPLATAEVAMAYGRFAAALRTLDAAIAAEPARSDLRLKRLEALVETGNEDAFAQAANELERMALQPEERDALKRLQARAGNTLGTTAAGAGLAAANVDEPDNRDRQASGLAADSSADVSGTEDVPDLDLDISGVDAPRDLATLDIDLDVEPLLDPESDETEREASESGAFAADVPAAGETGAASDSQQQPEAAGNAAEAEDPFDFDLDLLPAEAAPRDAGHELDTPDAHSRVMPMEESSEPEVAPAPVVEETGFDLDLDLDSLEVDLPSEQRSSIESGESSEPVRPDRQGEQPAPLPEFDLDDMPDELMSENPRSDSLGQESDDAPLSVDVADEAPLPAGNDDAVAAKLELAEAFVDTGDLHSAQQYLREVVREGDAEQRAMAQALLARAGE